MNTKFFLHLIFLACLTVTGILKANLFSPGPTLDLNGISQGVAFSKTGNFCYIQVGKNISSYSVNEIDGTLKFLSNTPISEKINAFALSPAGNSGATIHDSQDDNNDLTFYEILTDKTWAWHWLEPGIGLPMAVDFSADGSLLGCAYYSGIGTWVLNPLRPANDLFKTDLPVPWTFNFSPVENLAVISCCDDEGKNGILEVVTVSDPEQGTLKKIQTVRIENYEANYWQRNAFTPDGKFFAVPYQGYVYIYQVNPSTGLTLVESVNLMVGNCKYASYSKDGDYLAISGDENDPCVYIYAVDLFGKITFVQKIYNPNNRGTNFFQFYSQLPCGLLGGNSNELQIFYYGR